MKRILLVSMLVAGATVSTQSQAMLRMATRSVMPQIGRVAMQARAASSKMDYEAVAANVAKYGQLKKELDQKLHDHATVIDTIGGMVWLTGTFAPAVIVSSSMLSHGYGYLTTGCGAAIAVAGGFVAGGLGYNATEMIFAPHLHSIEKDLRSLDMKILNYKEILKQLEPRRAAEVLATQKSETK